MYNFLHFYSTTPCVSVQLHNNHGYLRKTLRIKSYILAEGFPDKTIKDVAVLLSSCKQSGSNSSQSFYHRSPPPARAGGKCFHNKVTRNHKRQNPQAILPVDFLSPVFVVSRSGIKDETLCVFPIRSRYSICSRPPPQGVSLMPPVSPDRHTR